MKKIFFVMLLMCSISAYGKGINIESVNDSVQIVRVDDSGRLLLIPIEDRAPIMKVKVNDNDFITTLRLARKRVDYYVPMQIGEGLSITVTSLPSGSIAMESFKVSNIFDVENQERFRHSYHFTAPYGWINDPNGMVYKDGVYHLSYQFNPYGSKWGNMTWGHAISRDLVEWHHRPMVIEQDEVGDIFSGSSVVDTNNVAGFGEGAIIAFYTSNRATRKPMQVQSMAYSLDGGATYTKYDKNPILVEKQDSVNFRDPKVFYHSDSKRWIMSLVAGHVVKFYSSKNLKEWKYESSFGEEHNNNDAVWECPDLIEMSVDGDPHNKKWVLIVCHAKSKYNSSANQYFVGEFDGHKFVCDHSADEVKWMDFGLDHYAAVTWSNTDKPYTIAWMGNWKYSAQTPTKQYRCAMTLVRELGLFTHNGEVYMSSSVIENQSSLRGRKVSYGEFDGATTVIDLKTQNDSYELDMTLDGEQIFGFKLLNDKGQYVDVCVDRSKSTISVDRRKSGNVRFNKNFAAVADAPLYSNGDVKLQLFYDKSSIELFVNGGRSVLTNLVFPLTGYNKIEFYAQDGGVIVKKLDYYPIKGSIKSQKKIIK